MGFNSSFKGLTYNNQIRDTLTDILVLTKYGFTSVHRLMDKRPEYAALKIPIFFMDDRCKSVNSEYDVRLLAENIRPLSL